MEFPQACLLSCSRALHSPALLLRLHSTAGIRKADAKKPATARWEWQGHWQDDIRTVAGTGVRACVKLKCVLIFCSPCNFGPPVCAPILRTFLGLSTQRRAAAFEEE